MFIHIPRSGGTYLSRTLAAGHGYEASFSVDLREISLAHFIEYAQSITTTYRFVSGHVPFQFVKPHAAELDLIFSTVRDPLDRAISMFGYKSPDLEQMDDAALAMAFQAFVTTYYFENVATRNEQCGYLGLENTFDSVVSGPRTHPQFMLFHFDSLPETARALLTHLDLQVAFASEHNESKLDKRHIIPNLQMDFYAKFLSWFDGDYMLDNFMQRFGPINAERLIP